MNTAKYYAFFDVDGTLVKGIPMMDFLKFYYQNRYELSPSLGKLAYASHLAKAWAVNKFTRSREYLNRLYYRCYKGQSSQFVKYLGRNWYQNLKKSPENFNQKIIKELRKHQEEGGEVVFVSGSFDACLEPLAEELKVQHLLCTEPATLEGQYTGKIKASLIGEGKANAIQKFLKEKNFEAINLCYAYGDHISDLPMLKLVGNPRVIAGNTDLELWANQSYTPILQAI